MFPAPNVTMQQRSPKRPLPSHQHPELAPGLHTEVDVSGADANITTKQDEARDSKRLRAGAHEIVTGFEGSQAPRSEASAFAASAMTATPAAADCGKAPAPSFLASLEDPAVPCEDPAFLQGTSEGPAMLQESTAAPMAAEHGHAAGPAASAIPEAASAQAAAAAGGMSAATTTASAVAALLEGAATDGSVPPATAAPAVTCRGCLAGGMGPEVIEPEWGAACGMDERLTEQGLAPTPAAAVSAADLYGDGLDALLSTAGSEGLISAPSWNWDWVGDLGADGQGEGVEEDVAAMLGLQHEGQPVVEWGHGGLGVAVHELPVEVGATAAGREGSLVLLQPAASAAVAAVAPGATGTGTPLLSAAAAGAAVVGPAESGGGHVDLPGEGHHMCRVYSGSFGRLQKLLMAGGPAAAAKLQRAGEVLDQRRAEEMSRRYVDMPPPERFFQ